MNSINAVALKASLAPGFIVSLLLPMPMIERAMELKLTFKLVTFDTNVSFVSNEANMGGEEGPYLQCID